MAGFVTWVSAVVVAVSPAATPAPFTPSIKVGVTIFADYIVTETPKVTDANGDRVTGSAFNVARSYINVTGAVTPRITFRVTPDIARANDGSLSGSQIFRLKYAYFDVALPHRTSIRFGMQQTPFIDGQEGVYRYRFQGTSFAERDGGLSSSDLGITARTALGAYGDVQPTPASAEVTGQGYSFFVTPFLKEKGNGLEALLRFDRFEPNTNVDAAWKRVIAGAAYWFPRHGTTSAALLLNLEQVTYDRFVPTRPTERRIGLYSLISF